MGQVTYNTYIEAFPASDVRATASVTALILELPGCFSNGPDETHALNGLRVAVPDYFRWLIMQDADTPTMSGDVSVVVAERYRVVTNGLYEVRAFFGPDGVPLTVDDLEWGIALMGFAHQDYQKIVTPLTGAQLDWDADAQLPSIRQLIDRLAQQIVWLSGRLDAIPAVPMVTDLPGSSIDRYDTLHEQAMLRISAMPDEVLDLQREHQGERWSLRKIIRRSIQLEREISEQLAILLAQQLGQR